MRQALAARTGLDGRHAFLQATRFCDVSDPEIVCLTTAGGASTSGWHERIRPVIWHT